MIVRLSHPAARRLLLALLSAALLIALMACGQAPASGPAASAGALHSDDDHSHDDLEEISHLHGLGFSADGRQLIVPAHTGLRIYENGAWHTPATPAHDYMGFALVDDGFYSSGHPAPDSSLVDPLGLVKSSDSGATLQPLGFVGESDFHTMGVGYRSHAIYLVNPAPNAGMQPGPYYSLDRGATWQPFVGRGVSAAPYAIAVHPDEPGTLALPTDTGLLQSIDYGANFALVGPPAPATAAVYSLDGTRLLFGATSLAALDLASGAVTLLNSPQLAADDVLTYIATSPTAPETLAVTTLECDIFLSLDNGATWAQIADNGADPATARP
jgi:hypothetical protein